MLASSLRCARSRAVSGCTSVLAATISRAASSRPQVAVCLSGCGVYDGSEVHEASAALVQLARRNADVQIFAPDKPQMHTVDHRTGEEMEVNRNVLQEAARIARGKVESLINLDPSSFDALVIPGGFGAAKNLSNFAVEGPNCNVDPMVERALKAFHAQKKPIGLCCIAPVIAARVLPGVTVTVGSDQPSEEWPYAEAAAAVTAMGGVHKVTDIDGVVVDKDNVVVTAPAFMCETSFDRVHDSVARMVDEVVNLCE